ncbi:MAG: YceI family protein [Deferribacteres bacterium]|nr:YceI family protein [candidate division KSB1 bacterium]MCB9502605.1 YceI family protein [Deferribacteres bacterium]
MRHVFFKIGLIFLLSGCLVAGEWQIDKKSARNVTFLSSTTLLDFSGKTRAIDGYYFTKSDSLLDKRNELYFEVKLAAFDTGISKRDRDMREDVLHTEKFPIASFKGQVIEHQNLENGIFVTAEGELALHGHSKKMRITAELEPRTDEISVTSKFSVFLKDFAIEAPSLLAFVKVAEEIKIELNFILKKVE